MMAACGQSLPNPRKAWLLHNLCCSPFARIVILIRGAASPPRTFRRAMDFTFCIFRRAMRSFELKKSDSNSGQDDVFMLRISADRLPAHFASGTNLQG